MISATFANKYLLLLFAN